MNPDRAKILLAFHEETDVLTKHDILSRSRAAEHQLTALVDMKMIAMLDWQPKVPRLYRLTPLGIDKRAECNVGD